MNLLLNSFSSKSARLTIVLGLIVYLLLSLGACKHSDIPPRVLVFSKTAGYRHESIPTGVAALRKLCTENGYMLDSTENAADFTEKNLKRYAAVVFLSTTGDVFDAAQEADFQRYIQAGGGFVGIHAATDTEYGWKWYGGLVGGYFQSHPAQQQATLHVKDHAHPATKHLKGEDWTRFDEWYNFKELNPQTKVLLTIDEKSYKGGENGENHPMSWYHEYDGGRAFYTALGHTNESYSEPEFLKHLLGGLKYAIGDNKRLAYENCRTERTPDPTRFTKTVLASELNEPMEFDMFPDGKILLVERRGAMKLFDPKTSQLQIVYKLNVNNTHEDGLMGLAIDPNWAENGWIYMYYSPLDESVNQLSRFVFRGDTLDRASEKVILKVATQRDECCHTGGSLQFAADGLLYLSTGDNTNPFDSEGYAPIDERSGRSPWDAQKSSANTMDLRGKILRIRVKPDGSYETPKDNLFTDPTQGRPEIYVMGCRNPFRISVDNRRKLLFWGEVGPDAGEPDSAKGPAGHDEVNRARAAGFFGWPYFVGNNKPYRHRDFATKKDGDYFDPLHPMNTSPNNTGAKALPPAQPAMIWYPYGNSPEFPLVGVGGRNAMAGPVYYVDQYPKDTRFPSYYDGKLIAYDWMRGWMMAATLDSLGNLMNLEPFADSVQLSRPMDMLVDKNGSLWVLEYGTQWFSSNPDARLSRIDYERGNRAPIPALAMDKTAGAAPCTVHFSLKGTKDYDGDRLKYELDFGDGSEKRIINGIRPATLQAGIGGTPSYSKKNPLDSIAHTYARPGTYTVTLKVSDEDNAKRSIQQKISVGNEPPTVAWDFKGKNRSFYNPGDVLDYALKVEDREDGSLANGRIAPTAIATTMDYLETGFDITQIAQGHQVAKEQVEYSKGKSLMEKSDCSTCHAIDKKVNGPSYQAISERYQKNEFAVRNLSTRIIKGGSGNWGETVMSAHPLLSETDAGEIVRWILTLGAPKTAKQAFPIEGTYTLSVPAPKKAKEKVQPGTYILKAVYTDRGSTTQKPLENGEILALRPAFMQAESADSMSRTITTYRPFNGDTVVLNDMRHNSFFLFKRVDMTAIRGISIGIGYGDKKYPYNGGRIAVHLDSPTGKLVGEVKIPTSNASKMAFEELQIPVPTTFADGRFHTLYFVTKNEGMASAPVAAVDWVRFNF